MRLQLVINSNCGCISHHLKAEKLQFSSTPLSFDTRTLGVFP